MASNPNPTQDSAPNGPDKGRVALDVATVVPWIAFWGWVALDSALAYRKNQAAQDDAPDREIEPEFAPVPSSDSKGVKPLSPLSVGARAALISAPVVAFLGPLLLNRFNQRRKP